MPEQRYKGVVLEVAGDTVTIRLAMGSVIQTTLEHVIPKKPKVENDT